MYLKEIEILGFKSFADKLNISLDENITCVVGPNGSGKSNIVDAVRWVLGEQSVKSLRGDNLMSDIIFQGSKTRKPLNVASVMLTFDNSDHLLDLPYDNVSVKRRLYRTGDNEYFLNGEKCRLKDITELFLDSGIGRGAFNIVSQGEISKILSNSAIERRSIIEASAGILKYKSRREEAIKKLDKTNGNLDRVNDIILEIEDRMNPLKEQSIKAKKYIEVHDALVKIEVSLLVEEITESNKVYEKNKVRLSELNEEILKINSNLDNALIEKLKLDEINLEKEINDLNTKLIVKTKEEEKVNGERNILKERSKYSANDIKIYENVALLNENKLKYQNEIDLTTKDIENNTTFLKEIEDKVKEMIMNLSDMKVKKDNLYKEYNVKNREYLENINKINIIRDNIESGNTINSSVRRILNNPKLSGIYDAFGNILDVDPKYSKALEVLVQGIKNNIIVENPNNAKEAINYLKNNNLGRATFMPLSVIKPRGIDYETMDLLEREIDYLGTMAEFVRYDEKFRPVVLNQLGNVVLVSDLDSGNNIARTINNRYRIVTLDGEIINVGGSITGGSLNQMLSPISLKNELNDLIIKNNSNEILLKSMKEEQEKLNNLIIECENKLHDERGRLVKNKEGIKSLEDKKNELKENLNNTINELNTLQKLSTNEISAEEQKINEHFYEIKKEKELLVKELEVKNKEKSDLKDKIEEKEAEEKINTTSLKSLEKELKDLELANSKLDYKLDNNINTLSNEYELTYEKAREEYFLDMDVTEAKSLVNKYKNRIKELGPVNCLAINEYEKVNERWTFLTNQRDDLLKAKDTLYSIIEEMDAIMKEDFEKTFRELEVEFKKVFQELFRGGHASLKLTDPTNLLETGVDIEACPPGKSLKSISLLSGGEKTLTAISLLFAILNVRKVPFCIFDEVEAALDEANVDIFGKYLNNYKNKTQFLLITHKKRTMEYAKTLYGITMQESGVSKLVSVKLEDE